MENDTLLSLQNINKYFGTNHILQNVYLSVAKSQVVSIIGPSGAGKSTLLRCINYLEHPDSGTYLFDGIGLMQPICPTMISISSAFIQEWFFNNSISSVK